MSKKVVFCGVPGMKKQDIDNMEKYVKEEYVDVDFHFLGEEILDKYYLIEKAKDAEIIISWDQEMDDEIYESLNLKAYCAASTGFNAPNIDAATKNGVIVTNVSGYCTDEVANHTVMMILSLNRKLHKMVPYVKDGNWDLDILGKIKRFKGSTVGLYGFGSISKSVCEKLSGFGVNIISTDPIVSEDEMKKFGVLKVDLDTLLKESDYLSLHTPLLPSTERIINMENLKKMKPTSFLINTARGGLIDFDDLYEALNKGVIQGAGLDVLENEPPQENDKKIIDHPNTIVTAHSAYLSEEASDAQIRITAKIVGQILRGEKPDNIRNEKVLDKIDWIK